MRPPAALTAARRTLNLNERDEHDAILPPKNCFLLCDERLVAVEFHLGSESADARRGPTGNHAHRACRRQDDHGAGRIGHHQGVRSHSAVQLGRADPAVGRICPEVRARSAGVDYDQPTAEEAAKCKISTKKIDGHVGYIVESPDGLILRKFVDTNDDNFVDQWSYYKDGLEVYRDIDSNFNGKADQYRWFHTAGSRWGLNPSEDGTVETWKVISAEEVIAEVVAAIAEHDAERFARLMLTPAELRSLGLGKTRTDAVAEKISKATAGFKTMSTQQKVVTRDCSWVQFSANRPGVIPAGTDDSARDLRVYENVTALVEDAGKHGQVLIGTLIQVGDVWR